MVRPPYCNEFLEFINAATTVYHAVKYAEAQLIAAGFSELAEDEDWVSKLSPGGKYFVSRNGSSLIAFSIGANFVSGGPVAIVAAHVDALALKVKPVSRLEKGGYEQLSIAPYSGGGPSQSFDGSFSMWWDRDLGIAGRVLVKDQGGKLIQRLVSLPRPVARIPSLAVHFGAPALGPFNYETNFVPIIGLTDGHGKSSQAQGSAKLSSRHSARLLKAISRELGVPIPSVVEFELELFDFHGATMLGLSEELIASPRLDDKLCSFAALWALINASSDEEFLQRSGAAQMIGLFDNEEIGSRLPQGAKGNFMQTVIERLVECQVGVDEEDRSPFVMNLIGQTMAGSMLVSADVAHAFNPNFPGEYLEGASPELNKGVVVKVDPNMHYATNPAGSTLLRWVADRCDCQLQLFHIRNDGRSGGTIGPMLSERLGCPTIDVGIPQLSMHSVRAITGSKDPGLGVKLFEGFFKEYELARLHIPL